MNGVFHTMPANVIVAHAGWRGGAAATSGSWQDKNPHIAAWTVGCFDWLFSGFPRIAGHKCDVRTLNLSNVFNETCTSQRVTR
ncbi:hypothetical protein G6L67_00155 [Agrobacterium tumefaciens]|uniref:hypothetical protein n=1 Tax=Agrobacterium tumefaciens TaxID=358 RepID=UPI000EF5AAEC|nr:hypothetical protein [Agrobacterium tumefaciens]AYM83987.1 hypothetical protein At12D1_41050 [Agrobacterium tumefaciens]NTE90262.1 hypothetical protein [Agrobacterium tumefaciens]